LACQVAPGRTVGAAVAGAGRTESLSTVAADGWGVRKLAFVGGDWSSAVLRSGVLRVEMLPNVRRA
jgi:hypothetical protein